MKSIAFHIQKGGQGKTTSTGNIAYSLSQKAYKVLMLDCDGSQGNLTTWFCDDSSSYRPKDKENNKIELTHELGEYFLSNGNLTLKECIFNTGRKNLDIIPTFGADSELKKFAQTGSANPANTFIFKKLFKEIENLGYDFVLLDMSPGMTYLEKLIYYSVDEIITTIDPAFFGLDGITIQETEIALTKETRENVVNTKLLHDKVILIKVNMSYKSHKETVPTLISNLEKEGKQVFVIGTSRDFEDCITHYETVKEYNPHNDKLKVIDAITNSILGE